MEEAQPVGQQLSGPDVLTDVKISAGLLLTSSLIATNNTFPACTDCFVLPVENSKCWEVEQRD